jgi:hypothetical protein
MDSEMLMDLDLVTDLVTDWVKETEMGSEMLMDLDLVTDLVTDWVKETAKGQSHVVSHCHLDAVANQRYHHQFQTGSGLRHSPQDR